jgi:hypothetical protein
VSLVLSFSRTAAANPYDRGPPDRHAPLPCVFGKSKKRKERNTTARVIPDRASHAPTLPFPFLFPDHASLSTGCVFLLASLKQKK